MNSPKRNTVNIKFWYHIPAHTVPFSFRFQNKSHYFSHTAAKWNTQVYHFSLLCQEETPEIMMNFLFQFSKCFCCQSVDMNKTFRKQAE